MKYRFPASDPTEVAPADPAAEPTRDAVNANPEDLAAQADRTRRYFRLMRRLRARHRFAEGLDSNLEDFA